MKGVEGAARALSPGVLQKAWNGLGGGGSPRRRVVGRVREHLLVTTNDSRLRLYGLHDYCMVRKYKGHTNSSLQIRAKFSESGELVLHLVICVMVR